MRTHVLALITAGTVRSFDVWKPLEYSEPRFLPQIPGINSSVLPEPKGTLSQSYLVLDCILRHIEL